MFVKRGKGKIFSNKLASSEVIAKPSKNISRVMRCYTLVNIERQKLAPELSEKEVFPVWLISTICMKSDR